MSWYGWEMMKGAPEWVENPPEEPNCSCGLAADHWIDGEIPICRFCLEEEIKANETL